jgi:hypothetical protein
MSRTYSIVSQYHCGETIASFDCLIAKVVTLEAWTTHKALIEMPLQDHWRDFRYPNLDTIVNRLKHYSTSIWLIEVVSLHSLKSLKLIGCTIACLYHE